MKTITIDKAFEFVRNGASIKQEEGRTGIPITRIETIWNGYIDKDRFGYADITYETIKTHEKYLLKNGDILMTHINSPKHLGKCAIYNNEPENLIHGMNLLCLRVKLDLLYPKFALYYFNSDCFKVNIPRISNQSVNQASFSAGNLKELEIPLPPLPSQKKIVAILDAADEYRQKTKTLIEKYGQLAQSVFLEMFGKFIYKREVELPIKKIATFIDYRGKTPLRAEIGIPLISAKCVRSGYFDKTRLDFITSEIYHKIMTRGFPKVGDVLFTTEGATMGFTCRIPIGFEKFAVGQRIITLQVKENFNSIVLDFMLNHSMMQSRIFQKATGSAAKGIRSSEFGKLKISVPPITLQNQFAERIQLIEAQKQQAQASLQKAEELFNSLLQQAFKGELVEG